MSEKMKPHSFEVTDGMERAPGAGDAPCGRHDRRRLGQGPGRRGVELERSHAVQHAARSAGQALRRKASAPRAASRWSSSPIAVSDGISMGHEGMRGSLVSREIITDSVECMVHSERLDALVTFAGCDKSLPGMLMAAARHERAVGVPVWRLDPPRSLQGPGARRRERVRGRRRVRGRHDHRERAGRDRAPRLPDRGFVRWDVHREHDGLDRGGDRHGAPGQLRGPGRRSPARRLRLPVRPWRWCISSSWASARARS